MTQPQRRPPEDHILPESYLRRFLGTTRSTGGDSLLHIYSPRTRAWEVVRPKQAFTRPGFLDLTDKQGHQSRILDKWVKKRESAAAILFQPQGLITQQRSPTTAERAELSAFVAHLEIRSPAVHEAFEAGVKALVKKMADVSRHRFANDLEGWGAHVREFEAATGMSAAGLVPQDLDPDGFDVTINRTWMLVEFSKTFESLANEHGIAHWRFLVAGDQDDFITCDVPIRRRTQFTRRGPGYSNDPLRGTDIAVFTPLTRKIVLAEVPPGEPACAWTPAPTSLVAAINHELFASANEFVFAGRERFTGHESMGRDSDTGFAGGPA